MLTQCDVRGAVWGRTAELRAHALLKAEQEVNAAGPRGVELWAELQRWINDCENQLSTSDYSALSDAEANAWVEWLEELQEKVRDAWDAGGTDKERIRQAVWIIVSCFYTNKKNWGNASLFGLLLACPNTSGHSGGDCQLMF